MTTKEQNDKPASFRDSRYTPTMLNNYRDKELQKMVYDYLITNPTRETDQYIIVELYKRLFKEGVL